MSSILEIGNNKNKCQKYTPAQVVETMLDLADYRTNLVGKTILENSFGTGNILKKIVVRYIESAIVQGLNKEDISSGLSNDIYGIELDKKLYDQTIASLNDILSSYSLPKVKWKLFNKNALALNLKVKFDFIIGNPPYISYKEMDEENRKFLKDNYEVCSIGKFDYCYAFIEMGIKHLKDNGKLVQLIPNNIYKNVFAKNLRALLFEHISVIYDYPEQRIFDKTLTSVSIFLYNKNDFSDKILYKNMTTKTQRNIARQSLGVKWVFCKKNNKPQQTKRFGDVFHASVTIATLYNKAFIVDEQIVNEYSLERVALRDAVSPKSLRYKQKKKIIFPYTYDNNNVLQRYTEDYFKKEFPNITSYLKQFKGKLENRDSDEKSYWYEYGRSQALAHLNSKKLLISTIITNCVEIYSLEADTIPFSGIYITVTDNNYTLEDAANILKSQRFLEYVKGIGINISGKSIRITCKDINDYMF